MSVNIQKLIGTLFQDLVTNNNLEANTKLELASAKQHFHTLQTNPDNQTKMINSFLGSLITALYLEGWARDDIKALTDFDPSSISAQQYEDVGSRLLAALPETKEKFADFFKTIIYPSNVEMQKNLKNLMEFCAINPENLEIASFTPTSNLEQNTSTSCCSPETANISMMVLGGFMMAVGITAVALAFTVLSFTLVGAGIALGVGVASIIAAQGIFRLREQKFPSNNPCFGSDEFDEEKPLRMS